MWRRIWLTVLFALAAGGCGGGREPRVSPTPPDAPAAKVTPPAARPERLVKVRTGPDGRGTILALPLEEYVLASVLSEIVPPPADPDIVRRVFEVQAIVARTYALANLGRHTREGFDLCDRTHCQLVDLNRPKRSRWAPTARAAVEGTRGRVLYYGNAPAHALFSADCGGWRADAQDVWGGSSPPYLRGGEDALPDSSFPHQAWRSKLDRESVRAALNANALTRVGARLDTIDVHSRDRSGRAKLIVLNGERAPVVRGEDFRAAVTAALGAQAIRSSRFEVRREGQTFQFSGVGFGHGVGLCQRGAVARLLAGATPEQVLAVYYPGTALIIEQ